MLLVVIATADAAAAPGLAPGTAGVPDDRQPPPPATTAASANATDARANTPAADTPRLTRRSY
jgi:hypothetical protein